MDVLWQKNSDLKIDHKEEINNLVSQYERSIFKFIWFSIIYLKIFYFQAIKDLKDDKKKIEKKYSTLLTVENDEETNIEIISNNLSSCPIKNCDGSGNINPKHNTHRK